MGAKLQTGPKTDRLFITTAYDPEGVGKQECALCTKGFQADPVEWRLGETPTGFVCESCARAHFADKPGESVQQLLARCPGILRAGGAPCLQFVANYKAYVVTIRPSVYNKRKRRGEPIYADTRIGVMSARGSALEGDFERRARPIRGLVANLQKFLVAELGAPLTVQGAMIGGGLKGLTRDQAEALMVGLMEANFKSLLEDEIGGAK